MTGRVVDFRAPGDPPVTKKGGSRSEVVPFVRPSRARRLSAAQVAERTALLSELALEWGVRVSFPDFGQGGAA
jgi:hypothetical protein